MIVFFVGYARFLREWNVDNKAFFGERLGGDWGSLKLKGYLGVIRFLEGKAYQTFERAMG